MSEIALASMGSGCLIIENNKVLLVRVNYGPAKGQFILPGGLVEGTEHPHETCIRELKEETGLDGQVLSQVLVRHRFDIKKRLNIYWLFLCKNLSPTNTPFTFPKEEIQEVVFMDVKTALNSEVVRPNTRTYIRVGVNKSENEIIKAYSKNYSDFIYT